MPYNTHIHIGGTNNGTITIYAGGPGGGILPSTTRGGLAGSPQIDVGTANLTDSNNVDVGRVFVYHQVGQPWVEQWVVWDSSFPGSGGEVSIQWSRAANPWPDERQAILNMNLPYVKYAQMTCSYDPVPAVAPTGAPGVIQKKRYSLMNGSGTLSKRGELFREITATSTVDHWRLWSGYVKPQAVYGQGGSKTVLDALSPVNDLADFHDDNKNNGGNYVKVVYSWGPL